MAYSMVPTPGSKWLCADLCKHRDCAEHRTLAGTICPGCKDPIGFERAWTSNQDGKPWHFVCLSEEVARRQRSGEKKS